MTKSTKDMLIEQIAIKLNDGGIETYRSFLDYLREEEQFYVRCYLIDNKYLFGSFVKEAKNLISK